MPQPSNCAGVGTQVNVGYSFIVKPSEIGCLAPSQQQFGRLILWKAQAIMREHNNNCRPAVLWHALMASWLSASDQSHVHVAEADLDHHAHSNHNSSAQAT